jgi:hypothetical protein
VPDELTVGGGRHDHPDAARRGSGSGSRCTDTPARRAGGPWRCCPRCRPSRPGRWAATGWRSPAGRPAPPPRGPAHAQDGQQLGLAGVEHRELAAVPQGGGRPREMARRRVEVLFLCGQLVQQNLEAAAVCVTHAPEARRAPSRLPRPSLPNSYAASSRSPGCRRGGRAG